MGVILRLSGADAVKDMLAAITDPARKDAASKAVAAVMLSQVKMRFRDGLAPDGTPWKPSVRSLVQGGKPLVDTGKHLRDGIVYAWSEKESYVYTNWASPSGKSIAAVHQFGATITAKNGGYLCFRLASKGAEKQGASQNIKTHRKENWGTGWVRVKSVTIPPRPFFGFNAANIAEILKVLARHRFGKAVTA